MSIPLILKKAIGLLPLFTPVRLCYSTTLDTTIQTSPKPSAKATGLLPQSTHAHVFLSNIQKTATKSSSQPSAEAVGLSPQNRQIRTKYTVYRGYSVWHMSQASPIARSLDHCETHRLHERALSGVPHSGSQSEIVADALGQACCEDTRSKTIASCLRLYLDDQIKAWQMCFDRLATLHTKQNSCGLPPPQLCSSSQSPEDVLRQVSVNTTSTPATYLCLGLVYQIKAKSICFERLASCRKSPVPADVMLVLVYTLVIVSTEGNRLSLSSDHHLDVRS